MKKVLTIAGSDSSGGAGIQADLKAMSAVGVYGMSVITAVTAQNTQGVFNVTELDKQMVKDQIECIFDDIEVDGVKVGMVSNSEIIKTIKNLLIEFKARNIVIDPVMVSKSGYFLLKPEAVEEMRSLIQIADIVTPNIPEAETLAEMKIETEEDMIEAGRRISAFGAKNVLVKGGHRCNDATDILYSSGRILRIEGERIQTTHTHGTGCTLSSAICSFLSLGYSTEEAVQNGKKYITEAIKNALPIGKGVGPVGHFVDLYRKAGIKYD